MFNVKGVPILENLAIFVVNFKVSIIKEVLDPEIIIMAKLFDFISLLFEVCNTLYSGPRNNLPSICQ